MKKALFFLFLAALFSSCQSGKKQPEPKFITFALIEMSEANRKIFSELKEGQYIELYKEFAELKKQADSAERKIMVGDTLFYDKICGPNFYYEEKLRLISNPKADGFCGTERVVVTRLSNHDPMDDTKNGDSDRK